MSSINYTKSAATGSRALGRRTSFGPYTAGRDIAFVVPAGVTTVYVTGCAQGGTSYSGGGVGNLGFGSGNPVFDGVSYLFTGDPADSSSPSSRTTINKTSKHDFGNDGVLSWRYFGRASGASLSGTPFIVSAGVGTSGSNSAGISWSSDGGYTFSTKTVSQACAKQVAVSNDGRAVVLWASASGTDVVMTVTKDFGTTWYDLTCVAFGDSTSYPGTVSFLNNTFVIGVTGAGRYRYSVDPTGPWSLATTGGVGDGCSVAWDGNSYVWGSNAGEIYTSASLAGPYASRPTQFSASSSVYVVAGQGGNFVAHTSNGSGATVIYSTNGGVAWTTAITTSAVQYLNGGLVYSEPLGQFVLQGTTAAASSRSLTGAVWTPLTNAGTVQGRPVSWNQNGYRVLCKLPTGVFCGQYSLTSATATAWSNNLTPALLGLPSPMLEGAPMQIAGSSSGLLLVLKGGKAPIVTGGSWAAGAHGGGSLFNGGQGATSGRIGGAGLDGYGGRSNATYGETVPTSTSAGRGRNLDASTSTSSAGGGTIQLHRMIGENARIPGAGGGYSDVVSGSCYRAGGGGSMFACGGDVLPPVSTPATNIAAEGIGQGGYGVCLGSADVLGAAGGGEACYRVPVNVVPGETLTITVPGRGSSYSNASYAYASSGGPGFCLLEWDH